MSRFQAQTNAVLTLELDHLQAELGLRLHQKADLLRELAAITSWVVQQSAQGRQVQASGDDGVHILQHPTLERLRDNARESHELRLSDEESRRLSELMEREFELPPALKEALRRIASEDRRPPEIVWPDR